MAGGWWEAGGGLVGGWPEGGQRVLGGTGQFSTFLQDAGEYETGAKTREFSPYDVRNDDDGDARQAEREREKGKSKKINQ